MYIWGDSYYGTLIGNPRAESRAHWYTRHTSGRNGNVKPSLQKHSLDGCTIDMPTTSNCHSVADMVSLRDIMSCCGLRSFRVTFARGTYVSGLRKRCKWFGVAGSLGTSPSHNAIALDRITTSNTVVDMHAIRILYRIEFRRG